MASGFIEELSKKLRVCSRLGGSRIFVKSFPYHKVGRSWHIKGSIVSMIIGIKEANHISSRVGKYRNIHHQTPLQRLLGLI